MFSCPIDTLENALATVTKYGLTDADFDGGTTEGFAAYLFRSGEPLVDVNDLSERIDSYCQRVADGLEDERDWDEQMKTEALELQETLDDHAKERQELAEFIRFVKFAQPGIRIWEIVAWLGTTPESDHQGILALLDPEHRVKLAAVLNGLAGHSNLMNPSLLLDYHPGPDTRLDRMIRLDIERFDATLRSAKPWAGIEEDWSFEMCALAKLVKSRSSDKNSTEGNRAKVGPDSSDIKEESAPKLGMQRVYQFRLRRKHCQ